MLADHQTPRGAGSNATPVSLDNTLDCATTEAALASIRSLVGLPANALRVARTRSKKLVSRADSHIRLWRAIYARKRSGATFVAVTGSSGKTTTTALIAHVLSGVAPVRSQVGTNVYRAHVRSLQSPPRNDCYFVSETGSDGPGTLTPILNVLRPTVGVVTLVALEHKSTFRSIDAVVEEKGKLVEVLPANGLAVLNYDDPRVAAMAQRTKARSVTFGRTGGDYVISNLRCEVPGDLRLTITHAGKAFEIATSFTGAHYAWPWARPFPARISSGFPLLSLSSELQASLPCSGDVRFTAWRTAPIFVNDADKGAYHSIVLRSACWPASGAAKAYRPWSDQRSPLDLIKSIRSLSRGANGCRSSYLYGPALASIEGHGRGHSQGAVRSLRGRRGPRAS